MDVALEFSSLAATKLIVYAAGALVHLFLMVLIVGQQRKGRPEWLLLALMAALFMWNSGNLLGLNVQLFYGFGKPVLSGISRAIALVGLAGLAPLALHVHFEIARPLRPRAAIEKFAVPAFYFPLVALPWVAAAVFSGLRADPVASIRLFARPIAAWLALALVACTLLNVDLARTLTERRLVRFHRSVAVLEFFLAVGIVWAYLLRPLPASGLGGYAPALLMILAVAPSVLVGYSILRLHFLELRVQRNLVYALVSIFALLLYLAVIRRTATFLETRDILPATVTETILIFLLVVLFEPVRRRINRALRAAFLSEFEPVQKLAQEIQEFAKKTGDLGALQDYVSGRVRSQFGFATARLRLAREAVPVPNGERISGSRNPKSFAIHRGAEAVAWLDVTGSTGEISGEQAGALEMLADQLAAALELCELISDKVKLERALAEKAKMAFLGEMATSIAHNVKNPLSSMKTIVQLLEEEKGLPERMRRDCALVAAEIDRLNANISQVLRYAKPARDTDRPADLAVVVGRVLGFARPEAKRRRVSLDFARPDMPCSVEGGEEAASDIVSNLVVNALEASGKGGVVRASVAPAGNGLLELRVEDSGPGVPPALMEKIFQPFFTTRPGGTGLGLAIVTRRAEEIGGTVGCVSPLGPQGGARFFVRFRAAAAHDGNVK